MNIHYIFLKIEDPDTSLARELKGRFRLSSYYHFESSHGGYSLQYNALFERQGEYTATASIDNGCNTFQFKSDYWNMLPHYIYRKNGVLIMSNNSIRIAKLTHSSISRNAVYDCLIFGQPYKAGSYFEDIKMLPPTIKGSVPLSGEGGVKVTEYQYWRDLLEQSKGTKVEEVFLEDFSIAKQRLNDASLPVKLQFSGGSDSVTIFSALRHFDIPFECISYSHKPETDKYINKFCSDFGVKNQVIKVNTGIENQIEALTLSNGMAPAVKFYGLYRETKKSMLFDGYSFFAGDYSDAFVHLKLHSILLTGRLLRNDDLSPSTYEQLQAYCYNVYSSLVCCLDNQANHDAFHDYIFSYIPSTVIGGVLSPAVQMGHDVHTYYLTTRFVFSALSAGFGFITKNTLLRNYNLREFNGKVPLGRICSKLDPKVYRYRLDSGFTMRMHHLWPRSDIYTEYLVRRYSRSLKNHLVRLGTARKAEYIPSSYTMKFIDPGMMTNNLRLAYCDETLAFLDSIVSSDSLSTR